MVKEGQDLSGIWRSGFFGVLLCLGLGLTGCATVSPRHAPGTVECAAFWQSMDEMIARDGAGDGYGTPVAGFDYLRADRFLVALADQADSSRKQRVLIEKMRQFDLQRRYLELEFLSDKAWDDLHQQGAPDDIGVFKRQVATCSTGLMREDQQDAEYFAKVMASLDMDQDYSTLYRALGLYPLSQLLVGWRVAAYQEDHPISLGGDLVRSRLVQPPLGRKLSAKRIMRLLRNSRHKPFLDFQPGDGFIHDLIHYYAPVFELGGESFGRIVPAGEEGGWQVNTHEPVVYYYLSQAMIQGIPALQLNYVVWFKDRQEPAPWYTQGHLDGFTLRFTLDWQGRPLVVDSIGNCGCFYFGLPAEERVEVQPEPAGFVPPFAGMLPAMDNKEHLAVQVEAGSNSVVGVSAASLDPETAQYALVPYETLERLSPSLPGKFFDARGFVGDSERFERFFLFPMGIPGVGSMRQRGHQPITLVGRAYFDDPYLFESSLRVKEALPPLKKMTKKRRKGKSGLERRIEAGKAMSSPVGRKEKYFRSRGLGM